MISLFFEDSFHACLNYLESLKRCEEAHLVFNWEKYHFMVREEMVIGIKSLNMALR